MKTVSIDLGSSSSRIFLQDGENLKEEARFPVLAEKDGENLRWNVEALFDDIIKALDDILKRERVDAVGICSWGVDYGYVREGKLIEKPHCYRSPRNKKGYKESLKSISPEEYYKRVGIFPNEINTLYQLLADKLEGCLYADGKLCLIADLLAYRLTGKLYAEETNASTTGLLGLDGKWDFELIDLFGIPRNIFPDIIKVGEVYGYYKNIPVVAACTHDTASAVEAMDAAEKHTAFIASGSWLLIGKVISVAIATEKALQCGYTNERISNGKISFLKNVNGLFVIQQLVRELKLTYKDIDDKMPDAKVLGVIDTNLFITPDDMAKRIIASLGLSYADPYDLIKTVYYSLAKSIRLAIEDLERVCGEKIEELVMTGGAIKAPYLIEAIKKECGFKLRFACTEGAIMGINKVLKGYLRSKK